MILHHRKWLCIVVCAGIAGCGDNMSAVMRDYYNLQHEIIDNMTQIVDETSAKKFNDDFKNRLKPKEEVSEARREKIENNIFNQKDKDENRALKQKNVDVVMKVEIDMVDARFRVTQNRLRRLIVKLCEEKLEPAKAAQKSFVVNSKDVCPNLTDLERGEVFAKTGNVFLPQMGGGMMMMMGMPPPGAPAAPAAEEKPKGPAINPKANDNYAFVIDCRFTGDGANPWLETRIWKSGGAAVNREEINRNIDVDIFPLYSNP